MAKEGTSFTYLGQSLKSKGYIMVDFDDDDTPLALTREIESGEMNKYRYIPNYFGAYPTDTLSFEVDIMKNLCVNEQKDLLITREEFSELAAWLTSSTLPSILYFDDNSDEQLYYFAVVEDIQPYEVGDLYGVRITFRCNSPYAYTGEIKKILSANSSTSFDTYSDLWNDYIYPSIVVKPSSTGSVTLTNVSDGNKSITLSVRNSNNITIDCQKLIISDKAGIITFEDLGISDVDDIYWPRLLGHGKNTFTIKGNCTAEISYREPRKVGAL